MADKILLLKEEIEKILDNDNVTVNSMDELTEKIRDDLNAKSALRKFLGKENSCKTFEDRILYFREHYCVKPEEMNDDSDKDEDTMESEANFYAAYSIAPPPMINEYHCTSAADLCKYFNTSGEMSYYAYERYTKWLTCGRYYKDYEIHLMSLFGVA